MSEGGEGCGNDLEGKFSGLCSHLCPDEGWAGGKPTSSRGGNPGSPSLCFSALARLQTQGWRVRPGVGSDVLSLQKEQPGQLLSEAWGKAALADFISCGEKILNTLIGDQLE